MIKNNYLSTYLCTAPFMHRLLLRLLYNEVRETRKTGKSKQKPCKKTKQSNAREVVNRSAQNNKVCTKNDHSLVL